MKAARRNAIHNLKCFWGLGHHRPNFDGYIYIHYLAPSYLTRISAIYFLPSRNVWLGSVSVCSAWQRSRMQNLRRAGKNSDSILGLSRLWTKFTKFSDDVGSPLYFTAPFSDCLCPVSFRRYAYSPLSLEVDEKPSKCKSLLAPNYLGGTAATFLRHHGKIGEGKFFAGT